MKEEKQLHRWKELEDGWTVILFRGGGMSYFEATLEARVSFEVLSVIKHLLVSYLKSTVSELTQPVFLYG